MFAVAACVGCHRLFSFNPERVPSILLNGVREPVCQTCVETANPLRIQNGLEPIQPLPGAYDSAEAL